MLTLEHAGGGQRVGQAVFRRGFFEYRDVRCAITVLGVRNFLGASHIKPVGPIASATPSGSTCSTACSWAHLDAAFYAGFITIAETAPEAFRMRHPPMTAGSSDWTEP